MARGPAPKPAAIRARRNKQTTAATLPPDDGVRRVEAPELPARGANERPWHALMPAWWDELWSSPMAPELVGFDRHGLYDLAVLQDLYFWEPKAATLAEIRLQRAEYGLTPLARRRLGWEMRGAGEQEDAKEPAAGASAAQPSKAADPRNVLQMVTKKRA